MDLPPGAAACPQAKGIAGRMSAWLGKHAEIAGGRLPRRAGTVGGAEIRLRTPTSSCTSWWNSIIGDNYPVPDRMLVHNEQIVHEYLQWAMCGLPRPKGSFKLYAVEGGTAAIVLHSSSR